MADFKPLEINEFLIKTFNKQIINNCKILDIGFRDHNFGSSYMYWAKIDTGSSIINTCVPVFFERNQSYDLIIKTVNLAIEKADELFSKISIDEDIGFLIIDNIRTMIRYVLDTTFHVEDNFHYEDFVSMYLEDIPEDTKLSNEDIFNNCLKSFTSKYNYNYFAKVA